MKWEDIEFFCSDCIIRDVCNEPCEDIKQQFKNRR